MSRVKKVAFEGKILSLERTSDIYQISFAGRRISYYATFKEDDKKLGFGFDNNSIWEFEFDNKELLEEVLAIILRYFETETYEKL